MSFYDLSRFSTKEIYVNNISGGSGDFKLISGENIFKSGKHVLTGLYGDDEISVTNNNDGTFTIQFDESTIATGLGARIQVTGSEYIPSGNLSGLRGCTVSLSGDNILFDSTPIEINSGGYLDELNLINSGDIKFIQEQGNLIIGLGHASGIQRFEIPTKTNEKHFQNTGLFNLCRASSNSGNAYKAFDENSSTYWIADNSNVLNEWIEYEFKVPTIIHGYGLHGFDKTINPYAGSPTSWEISGSNNYQNWNLIAYEVSQNVESYKTFDISGNLVAPYKYYRFNPLSYSRGGSPYDVTVKTFDLLSSGDRMLNSKEIALINSGDGEPIIQKYDSDKILFNSIKGGNNVSIDNNSGTLTISSLTGGGGGSANISVTGSDFLTGLNLINGDNIQFDLQGIDLTINGSASSSSSFTTGNKDGYFLRQQETFLYDGPVTGLSSRYDFLTGVVTGAFSKAVLSGSFVELQTSTTLAKRDGSNDVGVTLTYFRDADNLGDYVSDTQTSGIAWHRIPNDDDFNFINLTHYDYNPTENPVYSFGFANFTDSDRIMLNKPGSAANQKGLTYFSIKEYASGLPQNKDLDFFSWYVENETGYGLKELLYLKNSITLYEFVANSKQTASNDNVFDIEYSSSVSGPWTSIYSTKPQINNGAKVSSTGILNTSSITNGNYLRFNNLNNYCSGITSQLFYL